MHRKDHVILLKYIFHHICRSSTNNSFFNLWKQLNSCTVQRISFIIKNYNTFYEFPLTIDWQLIWYHAFISVKDVWSLHVLLVFHLIKRQYLHEVKNYLWIRFRISFGHFYLHQESKGVCVSIMSKDGLICNKHIEKINC